MLTEARIEEARKRLDEMRGARIDAAIDKMLAEGTAFRFDSIEALMEHLKAAGRPDETV
jgi:formylmethanofuran dehydrogenase subunit B